MQTLKINLHGESWTLKKFECSEDNFDKCLKVATKMKYTLAEALLDPFSTIILKYPKSLQFSIYQVKNGLDYWKLPKTKSK